MRSNTAALSKLTVSLVVGFALLEFVLSGCAVKLNTPPPVYFTLDAEITLGGKAFLVKFTWRDYHHIIWDEGSGVHPSWATTAFSVLRILDENYAVAIRLPSTEQGLPAHFSPNIVLINRRDLSTIREYEDVSPGSFTDGFLVLTKYEIRKSEAGSPEFPMSEAEQSLRHQISDGEYGSLLAQSYGPEQWGHSRTVADILEPLTGVTFFGKRGDADARPDNAALSRFHGQNYSQNPPRKFGFDPSPNGWIPSKYDGIFTYVRGFGTKSSGTEAIIINCHGVIFDLRDQELIYDPTDKRLIFLWPCGLWDLSRGGILEQERP